MFRIQGCREVPIFGIFLAIVLSQWRGHKVSNIRNGWAGRSVAVRNSRVSYVLAVTRLDPPGKVKEFTFKQSDNR